MGFDDRLLHTLIVKRLAAETSGGAETIGGADTTLVADTATGDVTVTVASDADISADDWLRIGDALETEVRQVTGVLAGVVTLSEALAIPHDAGDQIRELDDAGDPALDELGQPVTGEMTVATVPGLIQPRSAREVAAASQAGAAIGHFVGYMRPLDGLTTRDWIEKDGTRFDIIAVPDAAGLGHHLELALEQVS